MHLRKGALNLGRRAFKPLYKTLIKYDRGLARSAINGLLCDMAASGNFMEVFDLQRLHLSAIGLESTYLENQDLDEIGSNYVHSWVVAGMVENAHELASEVIGMASNDQDRSASLIEMCRIIVLGDGGQSSKAENLERAWELKRDYSRRIRSRQTALQTAAVLRDLFSVAEQELRNHPD